MRRAFTAPGPLFPYAPLIQATDGDFYGTTTSGGAVDRGTVFKMTAAGTLTVLHSFDQIGGAYPYGGLIQASDGDFYGTTKAGGPFDAGTVFKMTPAGGFSILHSFANNSTDGGNPYAGLIQATDGNFYGTTRDGGASLEVGTVFRITPGGIFTLLVSFGPCRLGGCHPLGGLVQGSDGNFYGTTEGGGGGTYNTGIVFKMTPAGTTSLVHLFSVFCAEGCNPAGTLIKATDGTIYGTTQYSGSSGAGTVFKISPAGTFSLVHAVDGDPYAGVIQATDGTLFGTTVHGGSDHVGTIFQMTSAGSVTVTHTFTSATDGAHPAYGALVLASDGSLYGTTAQGGASDQGTVFQVIYNGEDIILHSFAVGQSSTDGSSPLGGLVRATDGDFYGTTPSGGGYYRGGTIFRITPGGTYTKLYSFQGPAGKQPYAGLIQASDSNFYGTAYDGGAFFAGTIFRFTPSTGTLTVLHHFDNASTDGSHPFGGLIEASDGTFYGTTTYGGASNFGTVFRITPSGSFTLLHSFNGGSADGRYPLGGLVQATDGNLYGMTVSGGASGAGTAYTITPSGGFTLLHSFANDSTDGGHPVGCLVEATDGNLYGTTQFGGANMKGTVFQMTPAGTMTLLHAFTGADGSFPVAGLLQATDGNFYGTTSAGGNGTGTVFRLRLVLHVAADFDSDAASDITLFRPSTGAWSILSSSSNFTTYTTVSWGVSTDIPVTGDYDGDGKADIAVFRPSTGTWWILKSGSNYTTYASYAWGLGTDVPVPGDYDGDGKTDVAVFRPSTGMWWLLYSSSNFTTFTNVAWGVSGDVPVPGDYEGDGKTDLAFYRPSSGTWSILYSSSNYTYDLTVSWGAPGDISVPGDYDGDGKTDLAVYRPSTGTWFILYSINTNYTTYTSVAWGASADVPAPGDYDGDGKTDLVVFRPSTGVWFILLSSSNYTTYASYTFGMASDIPVLRR